MDEPILIFAYDEETERCVPVTDEDVERGRLEDGWVLTVNFTTIIPPGSQASLILSGANERWRVRRSIDGDAWVVEEDSMFFQVTKTRLSADEKVVCTPARVADLQPGMVFVVGGLCYVCTALGHMRKLGDTAEWDLTETAWTRSPPKVVVCCTRPSMQFILK